MGPETLIPADQNIIRIEISAKSAGKIHDQLRDDRLAHDSPDTGYAYFQKFHLNLFSPYYILLYVLFKHTLEFRQKNFSIRVYTLIILWLTFLLFLSFCFFVLSLTPYFFL